MPMLDVNGTNLYYELAGPVFQRYRIKARRILYDLEFDILHLAGTQVDFLLALG